MRIDVVHDPSEPAGVLRRGLQPRSARRRLLHPQADPRDRGSQMAACRLADLPTCRPADLPTCGPADLAACRLANLPTCRLADLLTRRPATCRSAQLPTCRLASWPTAAPTTPTMTARGMAIAITHATATRTATGDRTWTIYPNPAAQDAPPDPRFNIGGYGKQRGSSGQKCSTPPKSPPIPSSTLIWGAWGINIPSKSALGSNIFHAGASPE